MTYKFARCLYRHEPLGVNGELSRLRDAMRMVQDVNVSFSIRSEICKEIDEKERSKFFERREKDLIRIEDHIREIRNEIVGERMR